MKKFVLTYMVLLVISSCVFAQNKTVDDASIMFEKRNYVGAIRLYKKALRNTDDANLQQQIAHNIAMSYYNMNDYGSASEWFEDAIGDYSNNIQSYINYSQVLTIEKEFAKAKDILNRAKIKYPASTEIDLRIRAVNLILENALIDTLNTITPVTQLNSDYSDYSLGIWNDALVFSSARKQKVGQRTDGRTGDGFSNLYYSKYNTNSNSWSQVNLMSNKINSLFNDGAFTFDTVNNIAYWTTCKEKPGSCLIYSSVFSPRKNTWSKPTKVSFMNDGYSYGHPNISEDGNTLYFASNMPGGYGKNDLWKITRKSDGVWGIPINLGANINTEKNELFPSVYGDTLLFYSTDGLNTYGGLDIYFSVKRGLTFMKSVNIGLPLNSAADDFSLLISKFGDGGYFCSNRNIATGDDIYYFKGFPIKIVVTGKIMHEIDSLPLADAYIIATDENNIPDTVISNNEGNYTINLDAYKKYRLSVIKDTFFKEEKIINTHKSSLVFAPAPQLNLDFYLSKTMYPCGISGLVTNKETNEPMEDVKVEIQNSNGFSTFVYTDSFGDYIFDGLKPNTIYNVITGKDGYFSESRVCTLPKVTSAAVFSKEVGYDMDFQLLQIQPKKEITISNIYYDFNKATLREASKLELNKIASMLLATPKVSIQISAHTDARGKEDYNMRLSAERASSVVNYLVSMGVSRYRLIAKGYGESMLLVANAKTEEDHQVNRRTTFKVLDKDSIATQAYATQNTLLEYRIQILSTGKRKNLTLDFNNLQNSISNITIYENFINNIFKYEVGNRNSFIEAVALKKLLRRLGYSDCFIVSYFDGEKISVSEARAIEEGKSHE